MRLRIRHLTTYTYATPVTRTIQILRLTPRGHDGQFVVQWQIDVDRDCRLRVATDAFGNIVHSFTAEGPLGQLSITAVGEIETEEKSGLLVGQPEPLPPALFLRDTHLTAPDHAIAAMARAVADAVQEPIPRLHAVMDSVASAIHFDTSATEVTTTASEALLLGNGVCQDLAHVFIAVARVLGFPARYAGGYLFRPGAEDQEAGHGWAEAFVPGVGWIGFDPVNRICPTAAYVRTAVGLDYQGAAPIRGSRSGGGMEKLEVKIRIDAVAARPVTEGRVTVPQPPARPRPQSDGESSQ